MTHIQRELNAARGRLAYCRTQRENFPIDERSSPQQVRTWQKLIADEKRAEQDCSWLEHALSTPEG